MGVRYQPICTLPGFVPSVEEVWVWVEVRVSYRERASHRRSGSSFAEGIATVVHGGGRRLSSLLESGPSHDGGGFVPPVVGKMRRIWNTRGVFRGGDFGALRWLGGRSWVAKALRRTIEEDRQRRNVYHQVENSPDKIDHPFGFQAPNRFKSAKNGATTLYTTTTNEKPTTIRVGGPNFTTGRSATHPKAMPELQPASALQEPSHSLQLSL
ncbi:hypothetical protein L484_010234 [Morus notabilis]|uniref:Uncharacterized protein n=1 Tax=Morus notabilis TaxID=981085 RepID=W9R4E7_9ROSA|nr:hypothetical protein L484_010234 [Morus notabilis]